jgi:hypothetical protein
MCAITQTEVRCPFILFSQVIEKVYPCERFLGEKLLTVLTQVNHAFGRY